MGVDHFDRLSDDLLRLIFNRVLDAHSLGCCICVSRRFASLVPQTKAVSIVFSRLILYGWKNNLFNNNNNNNNNNGSLGLEEEGKINNNRKKCCLPASIIYVFLPLVDQLLLTSFNNQIESLQIILPTTDRLCEFHVMYRNPSLSHRRDCEDSLLKWKAEFGGQLKSCVILSSATSLKTLEKKKINSDDNNIVNKLVEEKEEKEEESSKVGYHFHEEMLLLDQTLSFILATRLIDEIGIIENGPMLGRFEVVADDKKLGQGRFCMNQQQIVEMRNSDPDRSRIPRLHIEIRYASVLELPTTGKVMEGASLVLVRPVDEEFPLDGDFFEGVFNGDKEEEVLNEAVREMMKKEPSFNYDEQHFF